MRRTRFARVVVAFTMALLGSAALPPVAGAAAPTRISFPVEVTYLEKGLTEVCGFEVWFSLEGTFSGLLFRDRSGQIVGEFNSQPNTWLSLSSPESGESIRIPFASTFHYEYPEGTEPGDPVQVSATGFFDKLPGMSAAAGRSYFPDAVVVDFVDGVPYVEYGEPSVERGRQPDYSDADANICAELAG